jgi:hypothetical protein
MDEGTPQAFASHNGRATRDLATFQLARIFEIIDPSIDPQASKPLQSPREISLLRDRVRELAERELAKPIK